MDAEYTERRREIESKFRWYRRRRKERKSEQSPSGNFELIVDMYTTGHHTWDYSRGRLRRIGQREFFADIKRNHAMFWRRWVEHANGNEYLLCGEDYQGQTIVNLTSETITSYFPTAGYSGRGFCWTDAFPSPDSTVLAVEGCYWACPYEIVFFDFREPDKLPYRELARVDGLVDSEGWVDEKTFQLNREIEARKSDGRPYKELSDAERADLDNQVGATEHVLRPVSVSLEELWSNVQRTAELNEDLDRHLTKDDPMYRGGFPNPDRLGFIPLRGGSGELPDLAEIDKAARLIGIPVSHVDAEGFEHEIIAAAVEAGAGKIAYVQCRAREKEDGFVDINFYIHLRDSSGKDLAWPIESYNPYFGCDVGFIGWLDDVLLVIYREKHDTYVCNVGPGETPTFRKIADDWVIHGRVLGYWDWQETVVSRLSLPDLSVLEPISEEAARAQSVLPSKAW